MAARHDASPMFQTVLYEKKGPLCYITLNRPEKLNAASDQLVADLNDALFDFDADQDLHVATLSGGGRRPCEPRCEPPRDVPPRRNQRGLTSKRRETRRPIGRAANHVRPF